MQRKSLATISQMQASKELPDDWDVVTLGDLFTDGRGIAVGVMYPGDHDPDGVPRSSANGRLEYSKSCCGDASG